MAYIIGIINDVERRVLEARGWELEEAPAELVPAYISPGDFVRMIWVDGGVFDMLNGPDCDKRCPWCSELVDCTNIDQHNHNE